MVAAKGTPVEPEQGSDARLDKVNLPLQQVLHRFIHIRIQAEAQVVFKIMEQLLVMGPDHVAAVGIGDHCHDPPDLATGKLLDMLGCQPLLSIAIQPEVDIGLGTNMVSDG